MKQKQISRVRYYKDNVLIEEINPNESTLQTLYSTTKGKLLRSLLSRRLTCFLAGLYHASKGSKKLIAPFVKEYQINMDEFVIPHGGFQSFNEFFIRKFRPGARPIDNNPQHVVAPADSKLYVIDKIDNHSPFFIKNKKFNLWQFLGDEKLAHQYKHGTLCMFRLAPYDYHRFHFPADCIPSQPTIIKGIFESVNPIAFQHGVQPLNHNERQLIRLETKEFDNILMIAVGAMMVGKIIQTFTPNKHYKKGDEAGYFAFGGSTIVLLFKPNIMTPLHEFTQHSLQGFETAVKMGEALNS